MQLKRLAVILTLGARLERYSYCQSELRPRLAVGDGPNPGQAPVPKMAAADAEILASPLVLPCGVSVPNRIAKGAMTESLADARTNKPNQLHCRLYSRWADGGLGLSITGNVPVDRNHREAARNVCCEPFIDSESDFKLYAAAVKGKEGKCIAIVQLTHAGRQTTPAVNKNYLLSASDVRVVIPKYPSWIFGKPRPMTIDEIQDVKERFAYAAAVMERAGFDGVELHAAHGYLISQFLSPLSNFRTDSYGGSAENRRRLLLETVRAIRARTNAGFAVGVKLNSADFQRGGLTEEESLDIVRALRAEGVDFIEVSGGTYESHAMMDGVGALTERRESTRRREAYFLDFAHAARRAVPGLPIILTGGFRSRAAMAAAIRDGACDLVGLGRPLCLDPELPRRLTSPATGDVRAAIGWVDGWAGLEAAATFWYARQLWRLAAGGEPRLGQGVLYSLTIQVRRSHASLSLPASHTNCLAPPRRHGAQHSTITDLTAAAAQSVRHIFLEPAITAPLSWLWDLLWPVRRPGRPSLTAGEGKAK